MIALQSLAWSPLDPWHLLVLGVVALLLFGKRLPEVGRSLGRGIAEFKKGLHDVQNEMNRASHEEEPPRRKLKPPSEQEEPPRKLPADEEDEGQERSRDE